MLLRKEGCGVAATAARRPQRKKYRNADVIGGTAAYELDWEEQAREQERAERRQREHEEEQRRETVRRRARTAARVQVHEAQHVSAFTIAGVTAVLVMCLLVLGSYIRLTVLSAETVELQEQVQELEKENVALTAEYSQMFDLNTVKKVARASGMDKPGANQICVIDLSGGDTAVVMQKKEPGVIAETLTSLRRSIDDLLEYFR